MTTQAEEVWTVRRILTWTTQHFEKQKVDAPRLTAQVATAPTVAGFSPAEWQQLIGLLTRSEGHRTMVFVNTKVWVERVARSLEKAGFQCEGRMRRSVIKDGEIQDSLLYACVRE